MKYTDTKHCDEGCEYTNPETFMCEKHKVSITPYQTCLEKIGEKEMSENRKNIPQDFPKVWDYWVSNNDQWHPTKFSGDKYMDAVDTWFKNRGVKMHV